MKVILASQSPRRKELLKLIVPNFEVMVSNEEEKLNSNLSIEEQVMEIACTKAKNVYNRTNGDRVVIGSDTVVTKNGKIYGKARNRNHAKEMIKELIQGDRTHEIVTGLCVLIEQKGELKEYKTYDGVKVYLKDITDEEIEKWLDTGNAMDKAAAYGIQNEFCVHVEEIEGNYTTALGLPTHKLYDIIKLASNRVSNLGRFLMRQMFKLGYFFLNRKSKGKIS